MKLRLVVTGKTTTSWLQQGIETYAERVKHYMPFEIKVLPDVRNASKLEPSAVKEAEGKALLQLVTPSDFVVLLDERGKEMTSRQWAAEIERLAVSVRRDVTWVIGGPFGFSPAVYERADAMLSLSRMTFPHEMVRLFFVEQLYRAMTIIRGQSYHHD